MDSESKKFTRHEQEAFFQKGKTKEALRDLAKSEKILIYCGAGVTYDLTNLGWDDLIKEVFKESYKGEKREANEKEKPILTILNSVSLDVKYKASIVMAHLEKKERENSGNNGPRKEKDIITEKLQEILYKKRGWGRGNLLSNIVGLSMLFAKIGREVEIVTTNYDVYLLQEFKSFIERLKRQDPKRKISGIKLKNLCEDNTEKTHNYIDETNGGGYIAVTFLHGRVDFRDEKINFPSGSIVFSEYSYAATRKASLNYLVKQLEEKTLLCLGSSLNDEPLIHALSAMKKKYGEEKKHHALVTLPLPLVAKKGDDQESSGLHEALISRGENIGLIILDPACFRHIAQFIEELINVTKMQYACDKQDIDDTTLDNMIQEFNFYEQLRKWHSLWEKIQTSETFDESNYQILANFLDLIKNKFKPLGTGEILKLEAWVRTDPDDYIPDDADKEKVYPYRGLSMVSNSMGPIHKRECWRREPLQRYSPIAAIRAFNDGKASLMGLTSNLGFEERASRWNSFLCVPIFYQKQYVDLEVPLFIRIPVGCIVLASTFHSSSTSEENKVFLRRDNFNRKDFDEVIKIMRVAGILIMTKDNNDKEKELLISKYLSS